MTSVPSIARVGEESWGRGARSPAPAALLSDGPPPGEEAGSSACPPARTSFIAGIFTNVASTWV